MSEPKPLRFSQAPFDAELRLVRHLVHDPPWVGAKRDDRGMRAAFRRWTPDEKIPSVEMLGPLWQRVPAEWRGLDDEGRDRAVRHAALLLHLRALGLDADQPGSYAYNLGAAAKAAGVAEGRFARLMNTPEPARLEALGRLFRRFRAKRVHLRFAAPGQPAEGEPDRRSYFRSLHDLRRDDLAALLAFLFTDYPKRPVARWAAGYYSVIPKDPSEQVAEPVVAQNA